MTCRSILLTAMAVILAFVPVLPASAAAPAPGSPPASAKLTPADLSTIRGANYRGAGAVDTTDYWRHYDPAETERDLGYADKLKLNQLRVFVNYASWDADKAAFRRNLGDLARTANRHHIGLMITVGDSASFIDADGTINRAHIGDFVKDLAATLAPEPALAFWDASNEPDYNAAGSPPDREAKRLEIARFIAAAFHESDPKTPVTIGMAYEKNMEALADAVDVLSFHDYLSTRAAIAGDIAKAKAFAARAGKQVIDTELGCIARANPYDVTLEEHMKAKVGWYVWELMITKRWGDVHGVFYPDGTVRDPAIPAAMLGLFRNRGPSAILENVNRENWVDSDIDLAQKWLANPAAPWEDGLNAAERLANLLEASQMTAMRQPPTRTIDQLRNAPPKPDALRALLPGYIEILKPTLKGQMASTGVRSGALPDTLAKPALYPVPRRPNSRTPEDTGTIRGANYCYAEFGGHPGMWNNYSKETTERDLTRAQALGINQIRTFLVYPATPDARQQLLQNLQHLIRAADARGIGVMPVVAYSQQMQADGYPGAEDWARALVDAVGKEPGLAFWDVYNEPDYPPNNPQRSAPRVAFARHMAGVFKKLDPQTPVTIGFAYEYTMEDAAADVDVLVYHGYQQTRQAVRYDIEKARLAGEKNKKQVMNSEIGCVCRANPYDLTIQAYMDAHVGFYMWELMIVWNGRGWGDVHGIFYPDGTVRDPSIPMAMMGIFRNRGQNVVLENPDREGRVTREIREARDWLNAPSADWNAGLDLAEVAANLLESAQLVPLHDLPTRRVALLRAAAEDRTALRALLESDIAALQPYVK